MRLLIIRHGEPIYNPDTLTEKGKKEAKILASFLKKNFPEIKYFYLSPLGRAQETAKPILEAFGKEGTTFPWLREFGPFPGYVRVTIPSTYGCWDYLPEDLDTEKELLTENWREVPRVKESLIPATYKEVCDGLDSLLETYGYKRKSTYYEVTKQSHDTICLVCHFGVESVILSHLMNCSPWVFLQGSISDPTSFTYIITEERRKGIASFRLQQFGDISHLREAGEEPSFSGRYVECFDDEGRH